MQGSVLQEQILASQGLSRLAHSHEYAWHAGYMVARVLGAAPVLADAIIDQLAAPSDKATNAGRRLTPLLGLS